MGGDTLDNIQKSESKNGFIKRLFCKHEYKYKQQTLINTGMQKMIVYKCKKCGKEKCKII